MSDSFNILEFFCRTEAYVAAVLNCSASRHNHDKRQRVVVVARAAHVRC